MKRFPWALAACFFATGCGGVGDVKGKVYFKGEPLKLGSVTAVASNGSKQASIDSEGNYELTGVGTGKVKFLVYCSNPEAEKVLKDMLGQIKAGDGEGKAAG